MMLRRASASVHRDLGEVVSARVSESANALQRLEVERAARCGGVCVHARARARGYGCGCDRHDCDYGRGRRDYDCGRGHVLWQRGVG